MATNLRTMRCEPEAVFRVLANAWLYPSWVVGASRMRDVGDSWPEPHARLHHSMGTWPLVINDTTSVVEWDPPRRMVLRARGWPIGEAHVAIDVKKRSDGCIVRIHEEPVRGPATLLVRALTNPPLYWRNTETLRRLAYLAEGGAE